MSRLSVRYDDAICKLAVYKNITFAAWYDAPQIVQTRAFIAVARASTRANPRDGVLWNAAIRGTPRFTQEVRDELVRHTRDGGSFPLGSAHLILRDGLVGASVRAFVSTVLLLGRPPAPSKVFGDQETAATWLAAQLASSREPHRREEILSLHQELCAL